MREDYSQAVRRYLLTGKEPPIEDEPGTWEIFALTTHKETVRSAWDALREDLLPDFIRRNPGRRPWGWWRFDAPRAKAPDVPAWHLPEMVEPRLRVGGSGAPSWEMFPAILPYFTRGIPNRSGHLRENASASSRTPRR